MRTVVLKYLALLMSDKRRDYGGKKDFCNDANFIVHVGVTEKLSIMCLQQRILCTILICVLSSHIFIYYYYSCFNYLCVAVRRKENVCVVTTK